MVKIIVRGRLRCGDRRIAGASAGGFFDMPGGGGLFAEVGQCFGRIAEAAARGAEGLPLTKRTGGLVVGVCSVLGVLAGLFAGLDELHLFAQLLPGAAVGVALERLEGLVVAGIPAGEAGGGRGVGEFGLDQAPFWAPGPAAVRRPGRVRGAPVSRPSRPGPARTVRACTLGGAGLEDLYITTSAEDGAPEREAGAVYRMHVGVPGLPASTFAG